MNTLHIKRDDNVIVISGDDKGKRGKVLEVSPSEGKVIVEGVNKVKKHVRPRRQGEAGGIIDVDGPIYACKVLLYCSKCNKGVRVKSKMDGDKKIRVCAKCGEKL
ncbi:MAG TPA: 50S ribosomal protein L24 [Clostridiales bacterium]|jgi:large subunit ribosomal protein L24|nr:50S ribosomal protein L24 [Clostridiales bacterium]